MQQQKTILLFAITVMAVVTISILSLPTAMASILRINTPNQGQKVPAGSFLMVTGTSMPSNATHTKCNVQLQTNHHGYNPVSPLGPDGTYTTWKRYNRRAGQSRSQSCRRSAI